MKLNFFTLSLLSCAAAAMPAAAQMYPNDEVIVNPSATGSQVLLYPGGKYGRVTGQLLQPGEPDPNAPIHLHMPVHRAVRHVAHVTRTKPKTEEAAVVTAQPRPVKVQRAPAPQQQQDAMSFSDLPSESASSLVAPMKSAVAKKPAATPPPRMPAPPKTAAAKKPLKEVSLPGAAPAEPMSFLSGTTPSSTAPSKPARVASIEPAPSSTRDVARRNSIAFAPGAEEPAPSVLDTVKAMSAELNNALSNGSARIQLEAYGGKQGDKSSDARRLSLKRALIVRQLLIDDGIPSERIDVRAMGGASDGALDRVDIFVRT